ncbi:endothelial cell-specific molecule 1-like [Hydractinia symbiolongicarpus]|uniref:endothelial cell-specific molecule 1-like n=1 Tax=Hydractinia symbiolongicarpus TaxID=13093 RepID=UPI00254BA11F|nr:endothelial cell-specific molecule 1-like [Hydractinia symbiolongicarpus]
MISLTLKCLFLFVIILVWNIEESDALTCLKCDPTKCTTPANCKGGLVLDVCGCCKVCAKVLGENCAGPFNIGGICDKGLACKKVVKPGDLEFNVFGTCQCPALSCEKKCRFGHVLDSNGCKTCTCHKYPKCRVSYYSRHHSYGYSYCHKKETIFCSRHCHSCCRHTSTCPPNQYFRRHLFSCKHHQYHKRW